MSSSPVDTDRNLLFAVLALQSDLLTQTQFVEACTLWASRKGTALAELLTEKGWLTPADRADVERLLERKLKKHKGDARAGLAEATRDADIRRTIDAVPDAEIRATVTPAPTGHVLMTAVGHEAIEGERYTITRLHATGGIGRVWLARDSALGREVALKDLRPERAANPTVWGRFLREAQITGQLEHPGIVPVYELGQRGEHGAPFYTMRFVRGQTLREKIAAYHQKRERGDLGALDLRELLTAFVGVCNAVAYAHSRGFVHRDLKPANVVLGDFGEVMVLDWGIAKEIQSAERGLETIDASAPPPSSIPTTIEATLEGQVLGTPAYMAPEQADGQIAAIDARTDVYGLGAILYELLTGQAPFSGATTEAVLSGVRTLPPERPRDRVSTTPRPLEAICLKALAKKPDERYGNAKSLAEDVLRFQADEPISAYREPLSVRTWRWARKNRMLVTSLVASLAVAVPILVVGMLLLNASEGRERKAREKEEIARKDEEKARAKAQENYEKSLKAADALAEEFARGIRPIAGTQAKTVIEILDRAKQITDDLLNDPDAPLEARERKVRMLMQFAELYRDVNRSGSARQSAAQAISLLDNLIELRPDDRKLRIERGKVRNRLGWALYDQGRFAESLAAFQESAVELEANGVETDPRLSAIFLASSHTFIGNIQTHFGDHEAAEKAYKRGLEIRRKAIAAAPKDPDIRTQLAVSFERYGAFLARYGGTAERKGDGITMLREGRKEMASLCAAEPWNAVLNLQYSKILTTLVQYSFDREEAGDCLRIGEEIAKRFISRDPDHTNWQREGIRYRFFRNEFILKNAPAGIDPIKLHELRMEKHEIRKALLAAFMHRNEEDPENLLWQLDIVLTEGHLGKTYVERVLLYAQQVVRDLGFAPGRVLNAVLAMGALKQLHTELVSAREHAHKAVEKGKSLVARLPGIVDAETQLIFAREAVWEVERQSGNKVAARIARWEYDLPRLEFAYRMIAKYPEDQHWRIEGARAYFGLISNWRVDFEPPDWDVLGHPEVIRRLLNIAEFFVAHPEVPQALEFHDSHARHRVGDALRGLETKGLLSPEGKKLLEKFPLPVAPLPREK